MVKLDLSTTKLQSEQSWLWHKKFSHLNFKTDELFGKEGVGESTTTDGILPRRTLVKHVKRGSQRKHHIEART